MRIVVTYDNNKQYTVVTKDDETFIISVENAYLMTQTKDKGPSGTDPTGNLQFEIKSKANKILALEDRIAFYQLYYNLRKNLNKIQDISIFSETSGNLLFSSDAFTYKVQDISFHDGTTNLGLERDKDEFMFIHFILAPYEE